MYFDSCSLKDGDVGNLLNEVDDPQIILFLLLTITLKVCTYMRLSALPYLCGTWHSSVISSRYLKWTGMREFV